MRYVSLIAIVCAASFAMAAEGQEDAAKPYRIEITTAPESMSTGGNGDVRIQITPGDGWELKIDTPFSAVLTASAGIKLTKSELTAKDFVDPKVRNKTASGGFKALKAGEQTIDAALTFFLCNPEVCKRHKDSALLQLKVRAPPPRTL